MGKMWWDKARSNRQPVSQDKALVVADFAGERAIQEAECRMVDDREAVEEGEENREQQQCDEERTDDDHQAILSRLSPRHVASKVYVGNES